MRLAAAGCLKQIHRAVSGRLAFRLTARSLSSFCLSLEQTMRPRADLDLPQTEVFKCRSKDGLLLVPAVVGRYDTDLLLDTGAQGGVVLDLEFARQRGLSISDPHKKPSTLAADQWRNAGVTRVERLAVLGRTLREPTLSVCDLLAATDPLRGEIAGYLGPGFVKQGVLVVAAARGVVGVSAAADPSRALKSAAVSITLLSVPGEFLPFTTDVHDAFLPGGDPPIILLDTGSRGSLMSIDYLRRKKGHRIARWFLERAYRRGAAVRWAFELPGAVPFRTRVHLVSFSPAYIQGTGMERVDAIIGMDLFSDWVAAFSFSARVVGLFPQSPS